MAAVFWDTGLLRPARKPSAKRPRTHRAPFKAAYRLVNVQSCENGLPENRHRYDRGIYDGWPEEGRKQRTSTMSLPEDWDSGSLGRNQLAPIPPLSALVKPPAQQGNIGVPNTEGV